MHQGFIGHGNLENKRVFARTYLVFKRRDTNGNAPEHYSRYPQCMCSMLTSPGMQHGIFGQGNVDLAVDRSRGPEVSAQSLSQVWDGAVASRQQDVRVELRSQRRGTSFLCDVML